VHVINIKDKAPEDDVDLAELLSFVKIDSSFVG
jgi:hypothetical protein